MSRQYRRLLVTGAFILAVALAEWPGSRPSPAYANVTLVSFTASTRPAQREIDINWETATEFDTIGFFVTRSTSADGSYARASSFIPHTGDTVVGAQYAWTDRSVAVNQPYWYKLEEIAQGQNSNFYGPISATLTFTPTVTATPTKRPTTEVVNPDASPGLVATPQLATGATITPRPTAAGVPANPATIAASPTQSSGVNNSPPAPLATPMPVIASMPAVATPAPPADTHVAPPPEHASSPTDVAAGADAPAVVVTEASPFAAGSASSSSPALILIAAALLFLGVAFIILRQARQ